MLIIQNASCQRGVSTAEVIKVVMAPVNHAKHHVTQHPPVINSVINEFIMSKNN
jgi:hypothetical protein